MGKKSFIQKKVESEIDSLTKELHDFALTTAEIAEEMKTIEAKLLLLKELLKDEENDQT